jgi:hypothetical protein
VGEEEVSLLKQHRASIQGSQVVSTLELANVGTIPIKLVTGTNICQLFLHKMVGGSSHVGQSSVLGQRQPRPAP